MSSVVKNPEQIAHLKAAANILAKCLNLLVKEALPGVSGKNLDSIAESFIRDNGGIPAFKNYSTSKAVSGFPGSICFSRNDVIIHGVPTEEDVIKEGDVITIDCGVNLNGWFADAARLFTVGKAKEEDERLVSAAKKALHAAIAKCRPGNRLGDVSVTIQNSVHVSGYFNVVQFCGHAIGQAMHESPQVPNYGNKGEGLLLEPGMVFCLEPVLLKHRVGLGVLPDKWTIVTLDGSSAAHVEHMVLITEGDPDILSLSPESDG